MRHRVFLGMVCAALVAGRATLRGDPPPAAAPGPAVETIVLVRHGEKPVDDKGQLNCRGLNRSLALPDVLIAKFGKPDYIFAPRTTRRKVSHSDKEYSYIRPLITIEPTAVRLDLPVDTRFAYDDIAGLQNELTAPTYKAAVIFIAWEHYMLDELARHLVTFCGADSAAVPAWPAEDYDTIFVLKVRTEEGKRTIAFSVDHEGLNGLSSECPEARMK